MSSCIVSYDNYLIDIVLIFYCLRRFLISPVSPLYYPFLIAHLVFSNDYFTTENDVLLWQLDAICLSAPILTEVFECFHFLRFWRPLLLSNIFNIEELCYRVHLLTCSERLKVSNFPIFWYQQYGALELRPQVIKITSCLPMVGGSLRVPRFLPPLQLVVMI